MSFIHSSGETISETRKKRVKYVSSNTNMARLVEAITHTTNVVYIQLTLTPIIVVPLIHMLQLG